MTYIADCSRAGIGYTDMPLITPTGSVADCSRAGIGYTQPVNSAIGFRLRIAHGPGLVTLAFRKAAACPCCGLLTGRDWLHSPDYVSAAPYSCGLLTGRDWLHSTGTASLSSASCGLLTGRDWLHYQAFELLGSVGCGLLTGRDWLHCSLCGRNIA